MKRYLFYIFLCHFVFSVSKAQDTLQHVVPNRQNGLAQRDKPYLIIISADAFRADFAEKYRAEHLLALKQRGSSAQYLLSSFPSLTFPNHYTIATGLYPSHHGIVDNVFFDKKRNTVFTKSDAKQALDSTWYGGMPLWVLAEKQDLLSAVYYWPGSEIAIGGVKPTYYYAYNELIPLQQRILAVKNWLALPDDKRPHLIMFYLPQVDQQAHHFGPDSEQTKNAVQLVDDVVSQLAKVADESGLPVNFIFLSDHGMAKVDNEHTLPLPKQIDLSQFRIPPGNALVQLYGRNDANIKLTYRALQNDSNYTAYLHRNVPRKWHYGRNFDVYQRTGDIILVPHLPKIFNINGRKPSVGQHGFPPELPEMHAIFYTWGPQIRSGLTLKPFENIHVYPFAAEILRLNYNRKNIDGNKRVLQPLLKKAKESD